MQVVYKPVIDNSSFKFDTTNPRHDMSFMTKGDSTFQHTGQEIYLIDCNNRRYLREISWDSNRNLFFRDLVTIEPIPLPLSTQVAPINRDFLLDVDECFFEKIPFKPTKPLEELLESIFSKMIEQIA